MTEALHNFIESLREELRQYGELLALLDAQHARTFHSEFESVLPGVESLSRQAEAVQMACRERDQRYRDLARSLCLPPDSRLGYLLPLVPAAHLPLLEALLEESEDLFVRVRHRARQNHLLLSRSLMLTGRFLESLSEREAPGSGRKGRAAARRRSKPC